MDSEGPDESFNILLTDTEYGHTANTANLNEDPEGGDAEICSAEPPADKMEAVPQKLQGDARKPLPAAEKPKKPTKNGQDTTRAAAALEIAPKRSQRRMEKIAKAEATAAAPSQKTVVNRAKITKVTKKTAPRAPRDAKTIPASATVQASPAEKKEKREQRLLAIREAAEKAAAVGGLTPPAPPSPGAEDFVDEEIIRSAEKKKRELEEAKILAQKPAVNKKSTTFSRKRKPGAKAIEEEKEDEEEGGGDEEQIDIEQPGPSSKHVAKPASKGKAAAEPTAARQSKRMRGDAPSPPAAAAAPKSKKKKNKKTITPVVGVTPPVDNNATAATTTLPVPTTAAPRNTIAAAGAAVDLSAMPPSALTAANATVAAIIDTFNDDDEDEDVEIEYIDHDHYADQSPAGAARDWIMAALSNPRGKEASSALLRESLENSVETIVSNIEGTISDGQNNSLLVLGGRGAGKTLAVERALTTISTQWNTDPADPLVGIVRLVGWAHADERTAFKEIARQLCGTFKLQFSRTASLGDNIEFLRTVLDGLARAHKVAVFVLDDFDLFAKRAKQTLLYCLLDALQTSGVQAVVIGTTVRHDCLDLLEKRVKSRFSHRSVMINPPSGALTIEPPRRDTASPGSGAGTSLSPGSGGVEEFPKEGSIEILRKMLSLPESFPHTAHMKAHNHAVNAAVEQKAVIKAINEFAAYRTNLHDLRNIAQATIAASSTHPRGLITQEDVISACSNLSKASDRGMEAYIAGLSVLELAVLVGAHRAARRVDGDPINFEMAFKEFYTYSTSGDHVDNYTKGAACKAFFKLAEMGLLSPSTGKADARVVSGNHFAPMYVQITALELRMGIDEHQKCPAKLKDWATREGGPLTTAAANLE